MTLGDLQRKFPLLVSRWIAMVYATGREITFGEAYRTAQQAAWYASQGQGIKDSLHVSRLALDFNLFQDGRFLTAHDDYEPVGILWEKLDPLARWGGRFGDADHISLEWEGRK